jgi:hypothetical protein
MQILSKINDWIWERLPINLTTPTYPYKPGDAVWVKEWNVQPLKPFVVILSTPQQLKLQRLLLGYTTAK